MIKNEWNDHSPTENESEVEEAPTSNNLGNIGETNVNFVQNESGIVEKVEEVKSEEFTPNSSEINIESNENDILDLAWLKLKSFKRSLAYSIRAFGFDQTH